MRDLLNGHVAGDEFRKSRVVVESRQSLPRNGLRPQMPLRLRLPRSRCHIQLDWSRRDQIGIQGRTGVRGPHQLLHQFPRRGRPVLAKHVAVRRPEGERGEEAGTADGLRAGFGDEVAAKRDEGEVVDGLVHKRVHRGDAEDAESGVSGIAAMRNRISRAAYRWTFPWLAGRELLRLFSG